MTQLDIIIPVYNEGENIRGVLDSLNRGVKTPFRLLICYDHDEDTTLTVLKEIQLDCELELVKNEGEGAHGAVLTGLKASVAPAVLVFPGDDDYNAGILDAMAAKIKEGCDIVAASRLMKGGRIEDCPRFKYLLLRLSAFALRHLARLPTHDPSNGFRMFSRRVVDLIEIESTQGFTYSIELLVKAHRLGWRIGEVPASWFERKKGVSRFRVLRWAPAYLRWFFYAFATTFLFRGPKTVRLKA